MRSFLILLVIAVGLGYVAYAHLMVFVTQPVGLLSEGRTLVVDRIDGFRFVDSGDAWCERRFGGVNPLCRAAALGMIEGNAEIYLRLPYSEWLHLVSTDGHRRNN